MNHRYHLTAAAAVVLLGGCEPKPAAPVAETKAVAARTGPDFAGPSTIIQGDCTGTKAGKTVRFKVKEKMLKTLGSATQYIERDVNIEETGKGDAPQAAPPSDIAKYYQPTYLDVGVPSGGPGTWTQVVVRLKNANTDDIRFMPVRDAQGVDNPTDSKFAVMVEGAKAGKFCGRTDFKQVDGDDVVKFGVMLDKNETVSINIGLLILDKKNSTPTTKFWIPIYLDPNMKNIGDQ